MAQSSKTKHKTGSDDFVLMGHTRAMVREVWDQWLDTLGQTPDMAKRMMTAAIDEMHVEASSAKAGAKHMVKRIVKKAANKNVGKSASRKSTTKKRTANAR